jgi:ABC-type transporter MlaC component
MTVAAARFNTILVTTLVFALLLCASASAQAQQKPEQLAQQSSDAWLAIVDSGRYANSWDEAAQLFKAAVTKDQWLSALGQVRAPQGKVLSRKLKSATYTKSLPNAPAGEYVVIQYDTNFENKPAAVETVTPMLEKDGKWRVSGYFIK